MRRTVLLQDIIDGVLNNYLENRVINNSLNDQKKYKYVLSKKGKEQLKEIKYNKTNYKQDSCPITLKEFEKNEILIQLPCKHLFVKESILNWLEKENAECPMCKHKLDSIKKEIEPPREQANRTSRIEYIRLPRINRQTRNNLVNYDDIVLDRVLRNSLTDF